MKIMITTLLAALIFNGSICFAQAEDCGAYPTGLKALFGDAKEKFEACNRRRDEVTRQNVREMQQKGQAIVDNGREACKSALRKMSSQPSTLSFDYARNYEKFDGLSASGLDVTDGGYSVKLSGSDVDGRFSVVCYVDKTFRVTNVR